MDVTCGTVAFIQCLHSAAQSGENHPQLSGMAINIMERFHHGIIIIAGP